MKRLLVFALSLSFVVGICAPALANNVPRDPQISLPAGGGTTIHDKARLDVYCYRNGNLYNAAVTVTEITGQGVAIGSGQEKTTISGHARFYLDKNKNYKIYAFKQMGNPADNLRDTAYLYNVQERRAVDLYLRSVMESMIDAVNEMQRKF